MWLGDTATGAKAPEKGREARAREGTGKAVTRGSQQVHPQAEDLSDTENMRTHMASLRGVWAGGGGDVTQVLG